MVIPELSFKTTSTQIQALEKFESIRRKASIAMGLVSDENAAAELEHTKIAMVSAPKDHVSSSGKRIGKLKWILLCEPFQWEAAHAMMGTAAVAIGSAAAIPAQ